MARRDGLVARSTQSNFGVRVETLGVFALRLPLPSSDEGMRVEGEGFGASALTRSFQLPSRMATVGDLASGSFGYGNARRAFCPSGAGLRPYSQNSGFARQCRRGVQSAPVNSSTVRPACFNPNSEFGLGGTGYQPVPSGHWPDGMTGTPPWGKDA